MKKYLIPVIALSNELHESYTNQPIGTELKVWTIKYPKDTRFGLEIEDIYDGRLDKFMEYEIPENIGVSNEEEIREAIRKWVISPKGKRVLKNHTWDFTSKK